MTTRAERIAEIRERVEMATPGPWRTRKPEHDSECGWMHPIVTDETAKVGSCFYDSAIALISCNVPVDQWEEHPAEPCHPAEPNAAFIAHARQDVPWLLEEVGRLEHLLRTFVPGPAAVMIGDPE